MIELSPAEFGPYIDFKGANLALCKDPNGLKFFSVMPLNISIPEFTFDRVPGAAQRLYDITIFF